MNRVIHFVSALSCARSSWGRPIIIRLQYSHNRGVDEFEVPSHANEAMAAVRRHIKQQLVHTK